MLWSEGWRYDFSCKRKKAKDYFILFLYINKEIFVSVVVQPAANQKWHTAINLAYQIWLVCFILGQKLDTILFVPPWFKMKLWYVNTSFSLWLYLHLFSLFISLFFYYHFIYYISKLSLFSFFLSPPNKGGEMSKSHYSFKMFHD